MNEDYKSNNFSRRTFLNRLSGLAASSVLLSAPYVLYGNNKMNLTVQHVIDTILKEIPGAPFAKTVDQLRTGRMEQVVTGIVTTMFPTIEVIEKTAAAGANMIIAHETPFYDNNDETDWLQTDNVYKYKLLLLDKHKIAVWRFHDYWHAHKPDGIIMGNLVKLQWEKLYNTENERFITLPVPMTVGDIVKHAKHKLQIPSVRVVGNLQQSCSKIYLAFGYMDSRRQIAAIQKFNPDLILSGETREWETVERVRDGQLIGNKTSLIVLSHAVSEEAGMEYAAQWLSTKVPGVSVNHIASTNPFQFI